MLLFAVRGLAAYWQDISQWHGRQPGDGGNADPDCDKLLGQGVEYFADRRSSDVMAKMVIGSSSIANVLNLLVLALGRDLLTLIGLIAVMVWQDPTVFDQPHRLAARAFRLWSGSSAGQRDIAGTQYRGLSHPFWRHAGSRSGFKVVKAFQLENAVKSGVGGKAKNARARLQQTGADYTPVLADDRSARRTGGGHCLSLYGGYRVLEANASPGELVSFMMAFIMTFDFARRLARVRIDIGANLVPAHSLYALFDTQSAEPNDSSMSALHVAGGRVELSDVRFAYRADSPGA